MPRYYITLPDPAKARGSDPALAFTARGAEGLAEQLQTAITGTGLFERWKARLDDPDEVTAAMSATDPAAKVTGIQHDVRVELVVDTVIPSQVLRQRLSLLAGNGWQLRDVT
ncbi:MAG: hypothetical protein JSR34_11980 [Proteobacteria bacterium]|nr:hypothetical protein [Pseudomonadota bacterium]